MGWQLMLMHENSSNYNLSACLLYIGSILQVVLRSCVFNEYGNSWGSGENANVPNSGLNSFFNPTDHVQYTMP